MRIGIFTDSYTPFINGVTTSVLMLKKGLEKKGHTVYVVTVNAEKHDYSTEENGKVLRLPSIPIGLYDYRLSGIYPIKAINQIKKWNLDVIHCQTEFGVGTFARIISKQYNIPLVHTYHTMYEDYVHYITKGYFNRSSKKILEYLTLFYCDKTISELVVPTKKAYELFKQKYRVDRNVYIVPTGIEVERFYPENNPKLNVQAKRKELNFQKDDFIIIFVGRVASEKNIELLLTAMPSIVNKCPKAKLLVVGDGPELEKYQKYTKSHKLENCITFAGKVPWDKVPEYYLISNVFTTASQTETQGLTVIEAMASSLPAICIDDESFRNTVMDDVNGKLFKNRQGYKKAIIDLYHDRDKLRRLSNQARISASSHESKYFVNSILEVYKIAIKNKPKSSIPIINKISNFFNKGD